MTNPTTRVQCAGPWQHRMAMAILGASLVTLWVGGLVTTTGSGMAAPDWTHTWGLDLLGWGGRTWWFGPPDIFVEATHRVLGTLAPALTAGLLAVICWGDSRRSVRWLALVALAGVSIQIVLGITRVAWDEQWLAFFHAAGGTLWLTLCVALAVCTSRRWGRRPAIAPAADHAGLAWRAALTTVLAAVQTLLGTLVRHLPIDADPGTFRTRVFLHLGVAAVLFLHVLAVWVHVMRHYRADRLVRRAGHGLLAATLSQIFLGGFTWVVSFGWPTWFHAFSTGADAYTISAEGVLRIHVVTMHVTNGAIVLAISFWILLEALRAARRVDVT